MSCPTSKARSLACLAIAAAVLFSACRGGSGKGVSADASAMRLTSGYTEIIVEKAKVPGYWAVRVGDGEKFFLYTLDRSYRKGEVMLADGAYGTVWAAVFDDATRVYQSMVHTNVFVVQRAAKADPGLAGKAAPGKAAP